MKLCRYLQIKQPNYLELVFEDEVIEKGCVSTIEMSRIIPLPPIEEKGLRFDASFSKGIRVIKKIGIVN